VTAAISRIFVYGAGGHGKVVADILLARNIPLEGFIDDDPRRQSAELLGFRVLGNGHWLAEQAKDGPVSAALALGDNFARHELANRCVAMKVELITAVHPSATIAPSAILGCGVVAAAGCRVNPDAQVGDGTIINTGAVVEHDCRVGNFTHLSPNAAMGGGARLGDFSWLGMGSVVIQGVSVGSGCIVGAGAAVVRDVRDWVVAVGVPARVAKEIEPVYSSSG
jgi:sugar O-acyltransferase (sialic acid O-acetyltransferase NeuD family)